MRAERLTEVVTGQMIRLHRRSLTLGCISALLLLATLGIGAAGPSSALGESAAAATTRGCTAPCSSFRLVLGHPVSLVIEAHEPVAERNVRIEDVVVVLRLVRELNHLTPARWGKVVVCPNDNGAYDILHFQYRNGDRWSITVHPYGCSYARFDGGPAYETDSLLLGDLRALLGSTMEDPTCAPVGHVPASRCVDW